MPELSADMTEADLLAWLVKLEMHPVEVQSWSEWTSRAAVGPLPGPAVMSLIAATLLVGTGFAAYGGRPWGADKTPL